MTKDEFLKCLGDFSKFGKGFKPHKHIMLLAVLQLVHQGVLQNGKVFFNEVLIKHFTEIFNQFAGDSDSKRPATPFFHLASHGFWRLVPNLGQERALEHAKTVGSSGELKRLVKYAELEESVFELMQKDFNHKEIKSNLELLISDGIKSRRQNNKVKEPSSTYSLFTHEKDAQEQIIDRIRSHQHGEVLCNLHLHDKQSNRYFETDIVVISSFGIYVVELKHWSGEIIVQPNSWLLNNSSYRDDPHKVNNYKAKLIRGLFERKFPFWKCPYSESVVVLTNLESKITGSHSPKTDKHNPTFDSIDRFIKYLDYQKGLSVHALKPEQCKAFADYLKKLQTPAPPKDFVFPGYEVVERLYQFDDHAEVVARRTDIRHRKLSRLRIFYRSSSDSHRKNVDHERATATLNAIEMIGHHPNILKVWDIPNDNNYIVEGSDWSESGTLRDVLDQDAPFSTPKALKITLGLANGLQAAHDKLVIHRALSPNNVLMVDDIPKLMNFDLAFRLEDNRTTVIPDVNELKRSPYIAPEIYTSGTVPEATADLFSLGVMLYEMLVGKTPFNCSTDLEHSDGTLTKKHRQELMERDVPAHVIELIFDLVRLKTNERIPYAKEVVEEIEEGKPELPPVPEVNRQLEPGEKCGVCSVQQFIGKGAESQIYKATGGMGKQVVLKLFNHDVPLSRVMDEQNYAASVRHHPSLIRVDTYNQWTDGRMFITFDWISERSLRQEINDNLRPDLDSFVRGANSLLDAIVLLHENEIEGEVKPILHNDIKPDNILLGTGKRPVLIDFGAASEAGIDAYEGTEGYVAPDLISGKDRSYTLDGDLYALGITLYEWLTGERPGCGDIREDIPEDIGKWLRKACSEQAEQRYHSAREMKQELQAAVAKKKSRFTPEQIEPETVEENIAESETEQAVDTRTVKTLDPNPFVAYLNSLHSRSAANENTLAESQARNPYFGYISVPHPVTQVIKNKLIGKERRHVVLTGHAGDGKSTIALELYKRIKGIELVEKLNHCLGNRENLESEGLSLSLIKDFSEWSPSGRNDLISEMLDTDSSRFLLISNTGTLLDSFKNYEETQNGDKSNVESELLEHMNSAQSTEWSFHGTEFVIINVAMMDNLGIAEKIFDRMLAPERWNACKSSDCKHSCPVYRNVQLIQENLSTVRERLFLAYCRMYEYGTRLTLRQFSAHMAYMITSGLEYSDISKMIQKGRAPFMPEFMFFNRFFGDDGKCPDPKASQLQAVRAVKTQSFGSKICPIWERRLWLTSKGNDFTLKAVHPPEDFTSLLEDGAYKNSEKDGDEDFISGMQAREQVRRILFFLHDFEQRYDEGFLSTFLCSHMLEDFLRWQEQEEQTLPTEKRGLLKRQIMHVLQEHFTGVRLPEGEQIDKLFVTLSRRSYDIRQSAQVVLGAYPSNDFELRLNPCEDVTGEFRRELELVYAPNPYLSLPLTLPFLDYVMLRNQGELSGNLQGSYVDRLEKFKGLLIQKAVKNKKDSVMLVRLNTKHQYKTHNLRVKNNRLEVTND